MPDFLPLMVWREGVLDILGAFLRERYSATLLSQSELESYKTRRVTSGWRIRQFPGWDGRGLDLLVDGDFPYSAPRVGLPHGPRALEHPHVEDDGVVCVLPSQATTSSRDPTGVADYVLREVVALLQSPLSDQDFRNEFLSYWSIKTDKGPPFISLLEPCGPSREVVLWRGTHCVCGENRDAVGEWLVCYGVKKPAGGFAFREAILIWLPQPLAPNDYPKTNADVHRLVGEKAENSLVLLERAASSPLSELHVVIGAPTPHGLCFAAMILPSPKSKELMRGFRPGRVPKSVVASRFLGGKKIRRDTVNRADHGWVHGRDQDTRQRTLRTVSVLVLGCGALGSGVARLLAQSGVGHLTLIDDQLLDWPNISRHVLGAGSVSNNKATALADSLRRDFPHLPGIEGRAVTFGLANRDLIDHLQQFSLVVCTTGEWRVDALVNDLQQSGRASSHILYGWMEAHGSATHALFIPKKGEDGCLRCGFSDEGVPELPVTLWPENGGHFQEPACGAVFSPFGAIELGWAQTLVAEFAIEALLGGIGGATCRTWLGSRSALEAAGGQWSQQWIEAVGDPGEGGVRVARDWPFSPTCPSCSQGRT